MNKENCALKLVDKIILGFSKNRHVSNFMKTPTKLFNVDGRTDGQMYVTKLIVAFRNFSNMSKRIHIKLQRRFLTQL